MHSSPWWRAMVCLTGTQRNLYWLFSIICINVTWCYIQYDKSIVILQAISCQPFKCRSHMYVYIYIYIYTYIYMFVVNFDALAQASDIRIERRQVVILCWMQDSNPRSTDVPTPIGAKPSAGTLLTEKIYTVCCLSSFAGFQWLLWTGDLIQNGRWNPPKSYGTVSVLLLSVIMRLKCIGKYSAVPL